ncbi:baseplate J/gp47 family protein (plasmid) [Tistrella mobilis]|uniref:baseplate assembly protein n=1 Tax=Tistrella mobilis TaxID=171437 RepID=UPI0035585F66
MTDAPLNLSRLPRPDVVETLTAEAIRDEIIADLVEKSPSLEGALQLESEPLRKLVEVVAYRELLLRQRVNDAAQSVMLAYATGTDLDHLAALYGVSRIADETDDRLRSRVLTTPDGWSVAGPAAAYRARALDVSVDIRDAIATSPAPGDVVVTVLPEWRPSDTPEDQARLAALLDAVLDAANDRTVRPLTDRVSVTVASILPYRVVAKLTITSLPDAEVIMADGTASVARYVEARRMLGTPVAISGLMQALHQGGVERVRLLEPTGDLLPEAHEAAWCEAIEVTLDTDPADGGTVGDE